MDTFSTVSQVAILTLFYGNFVISFLLGFSLSLLWGLINAIQLIVYLPLFNLAFPANVYTYFNILIEIANFDLIPGEAIVGSIFTFEEEESDNNPNFEMLGFETNNFILNTSSLFVYAHLIYLVMIAVFLLTPVCKMKLFDKLKTSLQYSTPIRFCLEASIEFNIAALICVTNA